MTWKGHGRIYRLPKLPYEICAGCGLVLLRNEISRWCATHGCDHDENSAYPAALKRLTGAKA